MVQAVLLQGEVSPGGNCIFRANSPDMRALKTILIILAALVGLLIILGLVGPSNYRVERSTVIAAPPEVVYGYVSKLASMKEWGPWQEMDKDQVQSIEGADGTVGAVWMWEGDTVGKGRQELTELVENDRVRTKLVFVVPVMGESVSVGTYDLEVQGDSTKITWGVEGENGFMGKITGVFMDMDKKLGPVFEKGLSNLKGMAEAQHAEARTSLASKTVGGYLIETVDRPETVYVGKRATVKFDAMTAFYGKTYAAAGPAIGKAGLEMAGYPCGVFFQWDEQNGQADMMAAMPVKAASDLKVAGMDVHVVPASKMLQVAYYGPYDGSAKAHYAIDEHIKAQGLTHYGNVIEEYVTDPMAEPDTSKWLTNIYYMIK
jgi:effector-binding domain-containing protein